MPPPAPPERSPAVSQKRSVSRADCLTLLSICVCVCAGCMYVAHYIICNYVFSSVAVHWLHKPSLIPSDCRTFHFPLFLSQTS